MRFRWPLVAFGAFNMAACATSPGLETYDYRGIDLGTSISGRLEIRTGCLVINSEVGPVRAILPKGSRLMGEVLSLPNANGGSTHNIGQKLKFDGGFQGPPSAENTVTACPDRGFIVNRIEDVR